MIASGQFQNTRRMLDVFEQLFFLLLYVWLVERLWSAQLWSSNWYALLILVSEGLVVLLLLVRRRTDQISTSFRDWAVAFGGTFLVLLVGKGGQPISASAGSILMLVGLAVHVGAKFSLRRSFGLVAADRGVKLRGLYAIVRHPMYAGYIMTHVGFLIVAPSSWNLAVYSAAWALMMLRIVAEERVLGANPEYRAYMQRIRYRLLPGVF